MNWFRRLRAQTTQPSDVVNRILSINAHSRRSFAAANQDRLTANFLGTDRSINEELVRDLATMRRRARQLAQDNDYSRRFLGMVKANVVGPNGITLQARPRREDGSIDKLDASAIETAWADWGKPANCTMNARLSWRDVQRLAIETVARDGEVLVRIIKPRDRLTIGLHVIEADYLDETLNQKATKNRNEIRCGVEISTYGKPIAYFIRTGHPGDGIVQFNGRQYQKIPARQLIHLYITERPGQARGTPWQHTAIRRLNMLGGYEEAELVAARVAASKMGFFTSPDADGYTGSDTDSSGNLISDAEPGLFEQLPDGMNFQTFDPQHPVAAFSDFVRATLRGAASGLGVSYHTLSNDLEGVNYSSIRSGVLEEREHWKVLQTWFSEQFCEPVYQAWLNAIIGTRLLDLPAANQQKFESVVWQPRGWAWVDPLKDVQANAKAVELGVQTRAEIAAGSGRDLDDMLEQLAIEKARMDELGLGLNDELPKGGTDED